MMVNETKRHDQTEAHGMLQAIATFRRSDMTLIALLDRLWAGMQALPEQFRPALGDIEDAWIEMEIIYAQASAAQQSALTAAEASDLEDAIDHFVDVLNKAMGR
jgi:hypothetical protein